MKKGSRLKKWETALLISLYVAMLCGSYANREQRELSSKIIRLHVIANSDLAADQRLKLQVRDSVLEKAGPMLSTVSTAAEAKTLLEERLPELEETAAASVAAHGGNCTVRAVLDEETYPTRAYDTFSLPAGKYMSLRIVLGDGKGKNWWCVVYPALCLGTASEEISEVTGLDEEDIGLITESGSGYVFKFKLLELWGRLTSGK